MSMPTIVTGPRLASRSNRLVGQFVDGVVGAAPFIAAFLISSLNNTLGAVLLFGAVAWSLFYYLFADGFPGGQSLGKRWLGMQVIDARTGAPCTFWQSFLRNLLLAMLGPIDWVFIFGERHQRLGDKLAGTIVIDD
jgi:uncharacterized RDD family membrane protein YckC